jgi:2Fe-2S iron-sulfur cluster binding domain
MLTGSCLLLQTAAFAPLSLSLRTRSSPSPSQLPTLLCATDGSPAAGRRGITQESSASVYSGAGPIQVDMNAYNLPLDTIAQEWTANLVPATPLLPEGVYLGARTKREIMVDTVKVAVQRKPGQGLGIQLLELAGGREDGYGITVVDGLLEGGVSEGSGIMVGDSISQIDIETTATTTTTITTSTSSSSSSTTSNGLSETCKVYAVSTECLSYDATVDAVRSLPPPPEQGDTAIITLKRLRRKPKVLLKLQYPPDMNENDITLELFAGENLRRSMLVKGVKLNDPLSRRFDNGGSGDCGAEGTCATCVVSIVRGEDLLNAKKTQEAQILKKNPRWRLACKTIVGYGMKEGELVVRVNPRQW